ncbi:MAG: type I restriction endonuclease [Planctomycetaceae bacterium]|nr:type I restriction endonuclease [Planctomycetaceae bacterium]
MKEIKNILKELSDRISEYRNDYISNEQAVRTQLIEPILNVLGWKTSNPKFVRPNAPDEDGKIPDYTLLKNDKTILIVEAKNLKADLQEKKIIDQLANYCFRSGIDFGILTNGVNWLLFKTFEKNPKDRIIWQVDIENDKIETVVQNLLSLSFDNIDTLDTLLKKSKILEKTWGSSFESTESIISIIAKNFTEKIKNADPHLKIDFSDIKSFTEGKIKELFELEEIEEGNGNEETNTEETVYSPVEDVVFKRHKKNPARQKISVTFPDKTIIKHKKVVETFVECIKKIGVEKIIPLQIYRSGIPLISDTKDGFYNQHQIGKYWIMVTTSTNEKMVILKEINKKLNLNLVIEAFTDE